MNICSKCGTELKGDDLLKGCPKCGSKLFKFVNTKAIEEKKRREKEEKENPAPEEKISIDKNSVESIKVEDKGVYEVNLHHILEGETDVFSDKEGNYAIDINSLLRKNRKGDKKD
ncbi:MAG: Zn-ribbon containing protein [Methanobrevibacter sp.]|uniref:OapC/ArvC family zinc-ribbon domain-containing protein n=1 Tax=Methanobrevibacter sp. TaxID=66852 RepID=UPI00263210F4|nr:Zn-ribbon containing protein [Methanobrevibacter sp.]MEA4956733.1 Zn-ribbon containing protein [Methanobrevibacter sp.]